VLISDPVAKDTLFDRYNKVNRVTAANIAETEKKIVNGNIISEGELILSIPHKNCIFSDL